jgi:DNA-binding transcriptional regulator YiaG
MMIAQARAELGLTGQELGQALGVTARTVRAWETGERRGVLAPKMALLLLELALAYPQVRRRVVGLR